MMDLSPKALFQARNGAMALAAHGHFWTGLERVATPKGTVPSGATFVEYFIPERLTQAYPLVLIHGGGGQGLDWMQTVDGRAGWAPFFLERGYAVYIVDRPGHGRAPFHPAVMGDPVAPPPYEFFEAGFSSPASRPGATAAEQGHNQWPGSGTIGDPALDAFVASASWTQSDQAAAEALAARGCVELIDRIGPAVVVTHSMGAPTGWLIADARPALVKAVVALDPYGPAFHGLTGTPMPFGITNAPLAFEPPLPTGETLKDEPTGDVLPDGRPVLRQCTPARKLPNLAGVPVLLVRAPNSYIGTLTRTTWEFLVQAGCPAELELLDDPRFAGTGHLVMQEKTSDLIAECVARWIESKAE